MTPQQPETVAQSDATQLLSEVYSRPARRIKAKSVKPMGHKTRTAVPIALVALILFTFTQLVALWPAVLNAMPDVAQPASGPADAVITAPDAITSSLLLGAWHPTLNPEVAILVMVVTCGLLGALVGTGRKFQRWAHLDQLTDRDKWSYALLPLQGAMLAAVVYFTFRGGFLGTGSTTPLNPYGIAAIAAIVGLFTDHAMHKLRQIMDTVFGQPTQPAVEGEATLDVTELQNGQRQDPAKN
jgi:hypothetical protein